MVQRDGSGRAGVVVVVVVVAVVVLVIVVVQCFPGERMVKSFHGLDLEYYRMYAPHTSSFDELVRLAKDRDG